MFEYQINPLMDTEAVRSVQGCEGVGNNNVTNNVGCAYYFDFKPPMDWTRSGFPTTVETIYYKDGKVIYEKY